MGFFGDLFRGLSIAAGGEERAAPEAGLVEFGGRMVPPGRIRQARREVPQLLEVYHQNPFVRMTVGLVARSCAKVAWTAVVPARRGAAANLAAVRYLDGAVRNREMRTLVRTREARPVDNHGILSVVRDGNDYLSGYECRYLLFCYFLTAGDSFWCLDQRAGLPFRAVPVVPTQVVDTPNAAADYFSVKDGYGVPMQVPRQDVLWVKDVSLVDPYGRGIGSLSAVSTEVEIDEALALTDLVIFENRARPDILIYGSNLDPVQARIMERRWQDRLQGSRRSHLPYIMGGDTVKDLQVKDLARSLKDQMAVELRGQGEEIIRRALACLPPELTGKVENSNRATIDAASYLQETGSTEPLLEMARSALQRQADRFEDGVLIDFQSPVRKNREHTLNVMKAFPPAFEVDEIRREAELDDLPGDEGSVKLVPISLTPTENLLDPYVPVRVSAPATAPKPETPVADPPPLAEEEGKAHAPGARQLRSRRRAQVRAAAARESEALARIASNAAPRLRRIFDRSVEEHRKSIDVAAVEQALAEGRIDDAVALVPAEAFAESVSSGGTPIYRSTLVAGGETSADLLAERTGTDFAFDVADGRVKGETDRWGEDLSLLFALAASTAARAVADEMAAGSLSAAEAAAAMRDRFGLSVPDSAAVGNRRASEIEAGTSAEEATRRANAYGDDLLAARAETVGEEECYAATCTGQHTAWRQGVEKGVVPATALRFWGTAQDVSVCPRCGWMEGQEVGMEEPFVDDRGDTHLRPQAHIKCRCYLVLVW